MASSIMTAALENRKKQLQKEIVRRGAEARARARAGNVSGGGVGRTIGTIGGAVGAVAAGQPQLAPLAAKVGGDVLEMGGKALDSDEQVTGADFANLATSAVSDKEGIKALQELLGKKVG